MVTALFYIQNFTQQRLDLNAKKIYVAGAVFYDNMSSEILEHTLRNAVMSYEIPDTIYFDNRKRHRSKWIKDICAKLDIRLICTKPFSPEAKGKVKR